MAVRVGRRSRLADPSSPGLGAPLLLSRAPGSDSRHYVKQGSSGAGARARDGRYAAPTSSLTQRGRVPADFSATGAPPAFRRPVESRWARPPTHFPPCGGRGAFPTRGVRDRPGCLRLHGGPDRPHAPSWGARASNGRRTSLAALVQRSRARSSLFWRGRGGFGRSRPSEGQLWPKTLVPTHFRPLLGRFGRIFAIFTLLGALWELTRRANGLKWLLAGSTARDFGL